MTVMLRISLCSHFCNLVLNKEKFIRPSSLHISCARSAQRACAKCARANTQAFKSLHPGNDSSSLHNAQNTRQTTQAHKAYEAIGSLGCSHAIFMPTQVSQSGPQPRRRTVPLILPARHCVTLLSDPAHAKAETWGGTFPHTLPSLHPENPAEPAKPIALQATGEPFPADWRPSLCVSQIHFQSSDFVWQNWRATGPDQAEFSIEESASSACAAKHDRVTSVA